MRLPATPLKVLARRGLVCLGALVTWSHAAADPMLAGCWQAVRIVLYTNDGGKMEDTSGRCTLRFEAERLTSTCVTSTGTATTTYGYRTIRPDAYVTTMTGSSFRTDLLGSTREYGYRIDGDRLFTVTTPPSAASPAPTGTRRVESEATRIACP